MLRFSNVKPKPDDILSVGDVALASQVSDQTVRNWHRRNLLPGIVTVGGRHLFYRRDVEAFIEARRRRLVGGPHAAAPAHG
jgi:DNA-binding transcriptional MerR regulator